MEMNKWLKELGLTWYDLPGNYISKTNWKMRLKRRWYKIRRGFCFMFSTLEDKAPAYDEKNEYCAFDKRNKIDERGFCDYEFYSLDYSMALYIYPRLCEFREKYSKYGTPSCFCTDINGKQLEEKYEGECNDKWNEELDKMILAFKYIIKEPECPSNKTCAEHWESINKIITEGLQSFAEYYMCLWW